MRDHSEPISRELTVVSQVIRCYTRRDWYNERGDTGGWYTMADEALYTVDDIATRLSVHRATVRTWIKTGELVAITLGGSAGYRITQSDLEEFLRKRRAQPKQNR